MSVKVMTSPEIFNRGEFSLLCNWRRLYRAVEVGVDRGIFSVEFMSKWQGHIFLGVDPYKPYDEFPWDRMADYHMAVKRYADLAVNCKLIRATSTEAAEMLTNYTGAFFSGLTKVDFIYIDGSHHYHDVYTDLKAWWPKVSDNGIIAGHDFANNFPDVKSAVTDFFNTMRGEVIVYVTQDKDTSPSWYAYKSGKPGSNWSRI